MNIHQRRRAARLAAIHGEAPAEAKKAAPKKKKTSKKKATKKSEE